MAPVMKFQVLALGENSEAKFVEAEVFTAPPQGRASAAGAAAAPSPHRGRASEATTPVFSLKHRRGGEQCPANAS